MGRTQKRLNKLFSWGVAAWATAVIAFCWPHSSPGAPKEPQQAAPADSAAGGEMAAPSPSDQLDRPVIDLQRPARPRVRPDWVGRAAWKDAEADYFVVTSGWWATTGEALSDAANNARELVRQDVFGDTSYSPRILDQVLDTRLVRDAFVSDLWIEQDLREYGKMHRAHLLVKITPRNREMLVSAYASRRELLLLKRAGSALAILFLIALTLLAYLRLDDATAGYYRGRLGIGALLFFAVLSAVVLHLGGWFTLISEVY